MRWCRAGVQGERLGISMSRQKVVPGGELEILTADELVRMIKRPEQVTRVRVPAALKVSAAGVVSGDVYKVPAGMEFDARRIVLTLTGPVLPNDPTAGGPGVVVSVNVTGAYVAYTRSGQLIQYGYPSYCSYPQVPGQETWGDQQGPYLRNGEVFGIYAAGMTANGQLSVYLEGLLKLMSSRADD